MALLNPLTTSQPSVLQSSASPNPDNGEDIALETAPSFGSQLDAAKSQGLDQEQSSTDLSQSEADQTDLTEAVDGKILQPMVSANVAQPANIAAVAQSADLSILDVLGTDATLAQIATADSSPSFASGSDLSAVAASQAGLVSTALTNATGDVSTAGVVATVVAPMQQAAQGVDPAQIKAQAMTSSASEVEMGQATSLSALTAEALLDAPASQVSGEQVLIADESVIDALTEAQVDAAQMSDSSVVLVAAPLIPGAAVQEQQASQVADTTDATVAGSNVGSITERSVQNGAGLMPQGEGVPTPVAVTALDQETISLKATPSPSTQSASVDADVSTEAVVSGVALGKFAGSEQGAPLAAASAHMADVSEVAAQSVVASAVSSQSSEQLSNARILKADMSQQSAISSNSQGAAQEGPVGLQAVLADSKSSVVVQHTKPEDSAVEGLKTASQLSSAGVSGIQAHPSMISHDGFNSVLARSSVSLDSNFTQTTFVKLEPHEVSLNSGPVSTEVLRVLKEGGGRVVMEVTPPDQGTVQLDLRLDNKGNAHLVVQGASDSTRARLEQGSQQLFDQFQNMGLNLTMDMRQQSEARDQSGFAMADRSSSQPGSETGLSNEAINQFRQSRVPINESAVSIYA